MVILGHTLAFALEMLLLIAVARAAYDLGTGAILPWVLAIAASAAGVLAWGRFAAPKSGHRLRGIQLLGFKTAMFALAAGAVAATFGPLPAALYVAAAIVHLALALRLGIL
jgi:hypothetical protein